MHTHRRAARLCLSFVVLAALCASCRGPKVARVYAGPSLPPAEEVTLKVRFPVLVERVDGRKSNFLGTEEIRLAPGSHVIEMGASFARGRMTYNLPPQRMSFLARPGSTYVVSCTKVDNVGQLMIHHDDGAEHEPFWTSGFVGRGDQLEACAVERRPASWQRPGTLRRGSVSGVAVRRVDDFEWGTAKDKSIHLVPQNDASRRWVNALGGTPGGIGPIALISATAKGLASQEPAEVRAVRATVRTTPQSTFTFRDVPPGSYYVIYPSLLAASGVAEVTVQPGQDVRGVRVIMNGVE